MYQKEKNWQIERSELIRERSESGRELFQLQKIFFTMQNKNTRLSDEADKAKRDFEMVQFAHKEENKKFSKIIEDLQSENKVCFSRLKAKNNVFTLNDL